MTKKPSPEEYRTYKGAHCFQIWKSLDDYWRCPACGRSKHEIMRWTQRYRKDSQDNKVPREKGWVAGLHHHHDHSVDIYCLKHGRFDQTIICDQCNSADGLAKRKLNLPSNFSFSPKEISQFVISVPHSKHKISYSIAKLIYQKFTLSKKMDD